MKKIKVFVSFSMMILVSTGACKLKTRNSPMEIMIEPNGPFMVNSYLVVNRAEKKCIIIDPGFDISGILEKIEKDGLTLEAMVATHGHIDHVEGVNTVLEKFKAPFYANEKELELIKTVPVQSRMFGVKNPGDIVIDKNLPESGELVLAGMTLKLLYTPGHSRGSVSILVEENVFTGDALFNMSIGRTDLPGGDYGMLISSIQKNLFTLPENYRIFPGHGPDSTIGHEKKMNPFFR